MPLSAPAAGGRRRGAELAIAWLSLFGLFAVVALFAFTIANDRDNLLSDTADRGRLESLLLADHAARLFEAADLALVTVVDDMNGMSHPAPPRSRDLFQRISRLAGRLPFLDAIWFHGADGRLWMSSRAFPAPPDDASDRDFLVALRGGDGNVHVSLPVGDTFRLSRRMETPSGGFKGVASITVNCGFFRDFYASLHLPEGSIVSLIEASGLHPLVQQPSRDGKGVIHDVSRLRAAIQANPEAGSFRAVSPVDGVDRIYAYRKVPEFPLYIKVTLPLDALSSKWNRRLRGRLATAAAAIAGLGALTWLGLRQTGEQRRFQETLSARVARRTRQLERAIHEVHHRVNNNLQIVTTLLTVQLGRVYDPVVREALEEGIGRIGAIGLVHRVMYGSGALADLAFGDYLHALARQMSDLYGLGAGLMEITGDNPDLPLETAVPLALLVHELLAASARPGQLVTIHLEREGAHWRLDMTNVHPPDHTHLASQIAPLLADQLGATLRTEGNGIPSVTLTWPVTPP